MQFINNHRLNQGQAMFEYIAAIPFTIMLIIALSVAVGRVAERFREVPEALTYGLPCDTADNSVATGGDHSIEVTSTVYDPDSNITTITYTVTSGPSPSISHWTIGIPQNVAANLVSASEAYESWGEDPTTGLSGIKFDTGYEVADGGKPGNGNPGGRPGNGNNSDGTANADFGKTFAKFMAEDYNTVSRDVTMSFTGQYDFGEIYLAIKAGQDVHTTTIIAPVSIHGPNLDEDCG